MFRALVRAILVIALVVIVIGAAGVFLLGHQPGPRRATTGAVEGTSGRSDVAATARDKGAAIGERVGLAAAAVQDAVSDGAITAKIKSKMALDDTIKARDIHVSTKDAVVTLSGRVANAAEHDRAMQLARETDGVKSVTDGLTVK